MCSVTQSLRRYASRMSDMNLARQQFDRKVRRLTILCLVIWAGVTLVPVYGARRLNFEVWGWPFNFWMAAQGCVLVYLVLVIGFAWQVNRWEAALHAAEDSAAAT